MKTTPDPDHMDYYDRHLRRILVIGASAGIGCVALLILALNLSNYYYREVMEEFRASSERNAARYDQIDRRLDAIADALELPKPEMLIQPPKSRSRP